MILNGDSTLDIEVEEVDKFYARVINVKGPRIREVYYSEFPYTNQLKGMVSNGMAILRSVPSVRYRYTLKFDGYPDATCNYMMPRNDILIIHDGGGTPDDNSCSIGSMDDIPDPPEQGMVSFDTNPSNAKVEISLAGTIQRDKKKYDIEFERLYEYTVRAEGYLEQNGTFIVYPWEVSTNINVELEKISDINIKVHPILPDRVQVQVKIDGSWIDAPEVDKYYDFSLYANGNNTGSTDNEYTLHSIKNMPSGLYEYKALFEGVQFASGEIDQDSTKPEPVLIKVPDGIDRKYVLDLNIGDINRDNLEIIYNYDGDMNNWVEVDKNDSKIYISESPSNEIMMQIRGLDIESTGGVFKIGNPRVEGGYGTLYMSVKPDDPTIGDIEENSPEPPEDLPLPPPIINDVEVLFNVLPSGKDTKMIVYDGLIDVEDIVINDKSYKRFYVSYGWDYNIKIYRDGYDDYELTYAKNANIRPGDIDETIILRELSKCIVKVNPITLDGISVKLTLEDGTIIDLPETGTEIPYREYGIYGSKASTELQYKLFTDVGIKSGNIDYEIIHGDKIIYGGSFYNSFDDGSETIVDLGSHPERYYKFFFKIYNEMGVDITENVELSIIINDDWVKIDQGYELYGSSQTNLYYRIKSNGYKLKTDIINFKDTAVFGGGIIDIVANMEIGEPLGDDTAGDPEELPPNQRYLWVEVDPKEAVVSLNTTRHVTRGGTVVNHYRFKYNGWVIKNNTNVHEFIVTQNYNGSMYISIEKEGYKPISRDRIYWSELEYDKIHKIYILSEWGVFYIGVNPITIDNMSVSVQDPEDPTKMISFRFIEDAMGKYPTNYNMSENIYDNQCKIYMISLKDGLACYGSYKYQIKARNNILKEGTVLHSKLNNESIDPKDYPNMAYIGDHDSRYYLFKTDPRGSEGSSLFNADMYVYDFINKKWINRRRGRDIRTSPLDKRVVYTHVIEGYRTIIRDVVMNRNGVESGRVVEAEHILPLGISSIPTDPPNDDMQPTDPATLPLGKSLVYIRCDLYDPDIVHGNEWNIPPSSYDGNIEFNVTPAYKGRLVKTQLYSNYNSVDFTSYEYIVDTDRINNLRYSIRVKESYRHDINISYTRNGAIVDDSLDVSDIYNNNNNSKHFHMILRSFTIKLDTDTIDGLNIQLQSKYWLGNSIVAFRNIRDNDTDMFRSNRVVYRSPIVPAARADLAKYDKYSNLKLFDILFRQGSTIIDTRKFGEGSYGSNNFIMGSNIRRYHNVYIEIVVAPFNAIAIMTDVKYEYWDNSTNNPGWRGNNNNIIRIYGNRSKVKFRISKPGFETMLYNYTLRSNRTFEVNTGYSRGVEVDAIHGGRHHHTVRVTLRPYDEKKRTIITFYTMVQNTNDNSNLIKYPLTCKIQVMGNWNTISNGGPMSFYDEGSYKLELPPTINYNGKTLYRKNKNTTHYVGINLYTEEDSYDMIYDEYLRL